MTMGVLKKIQYNCRKATFLIEKRQGSRLSLREWLELRIHLAGCSVCRIFEQQSRRINGMLKELFHDAGTDAGQLDERVKREMQEKIDARLEDR